MTSKPPQEPRHLVLETLSRVTQKYVAADKLYCSSKAHSGECEEDALRNIMALYCETNKYKDKGLLCTPGPIKFMEAVMFLSKTPKFSMKGGGESCKTSGRDLKFKIGKNADEDDIGRIEGDQSGKRGNISMDQPSLKRPTGLKNRKQYEKGDNGWQRVARSVDNMAAALKTAATDKHKAASLGLQLEILKITPMPDDEKIFDSSEREPEIASRHSDIIVRKKSEKVDSSSLLSTPSSVVRGPNSSSVQPFPEESRTDCLRNRYRLPAN